MANLQLAVNGEYFDAMKRGEKTEEYRLFNEYWRRRLVCEAWEDFPRKFDRLIITRGYRNIAAVAAVTAGASVTSTNGVMPLSTKRRGLKRLSANVASLLMLAVMAITIHSILIQIARAVMAKE